ncbi:MAG: ABC transporter substrate binding protein, partial [Pseudomonadota bacterium]
LGIAGSADQPHPVIGKRIPVIFALVADPVAAKITHTFNNHGRNICGVTHVAPLSAQLLAMRSYRPVAGVGIIYNQLEPNSVANVTEWQRLGKAGNFAVVAENFPVSQIGQLLPSSSETNTKIIDRIAKSGVNWLYLGPDSYLFSQLDSVATAATERGLMTFAAVESMLNSNAPIMSGLVSKFYQVGQFAALKAQQVLSGQSNIPIETLKRFSFIIRLDTAKMLSAYPPLGLIDYAEFRR